MKSLLVMAQIAGRSCAFSAHDVQSVVDLGEVTPIPSAPSHIAGITALRSQVLTVIDCRIALGFNAADWSMDHRAIVVTVDGYFYALKIDAIEDVTTAVTEAGPIPGESSSKWTHAASGMIETMAGPALLLDLKRLLEPRGDIGAAA